MALVLALEEDTPEAQPVEYRGIKYRSKCEAKWAFTMCNLGISFEYEQYLLRLDVGNSIAETFKENNIDDWYTITNECYIDGYLYYLFDFYLPMYRTIIEVKNPEPTFLSSVKAALASEAIPVAMLCGGVPSINILTSGETIPERSFLYNYGQGSNYDVEAQVMISICQGCGCLGFATETTSLHTCECPIPLKTSLQAKTQRYILDVYKAASNYPYIPVTEKLGYTSDIKAISPEEFRQHAEGRYRGHLPVAI